MKSPPIPSVTIQTAHSAMVSNSLTILKTMDYSSFQREKILHFFPQASIAPVNPGI